MTAADHIKRTIILLFSDVPSPMDTSERVAEEWDKFETVDPDEKTDLLNGFRESGEDSGIPSSEFSRHLECREVAVQLPDGTWVGWTYWYGGGKHADPAAVDWLDDAYFVEMVPEVQTVNTFTRKD